MAVTLGSKNVGDVIKLRENGALVDFLIVHRGLPSAVYDTSCDGVWVMRTVYHSEIKWAETGGVEYMSSNAFAWLENTYYHMFDAQTKNGIKKVRIPYANLANSMLSGASGVECRCFLPSATELNLGDGSGGDSHRYDEGAQLLYFQGDNGAEFLVNAQVNAGSGVAIRSNVLSNNTNTMRPDTSAAASIGKISGAYKKSMSCGTKTSTRKICPIMVLDYNMLVDGSGIATANTAPSTPGSISVPGSIRGGSTITVSWGASTDAQGNLEGYKVERSVNSGAWSQIYQGGGTSTANNVAYGTNTVMYRVKAYDSLGAESGYRTSSNVTVVNNTAPGAPQGITVPADVKGGKQLKISWGPSVDAENNLAGYELERSVDGGTWTQVYKNAQQSFTDNITSGWNTVAYRVRAYDAYNAYSGYATSEARAVDNNRPPEIASDFESGSDLGVKGEGFSITYTVTDPDNNTGDVAVTESLDGEKKNEFSPELGAVNTFAVEGTEFQCLPNGQHNILISASDGKLAGTHTLAFTKSVTSAMVTLETPLEADDQITVCAIAVSGHIPQDAQFKVLVTNNADDTEPKWENCTQMVKDGANYVFSNQAAENGYAFNFKITVSRGGSGEGGYITSVQGGFQ